MADHGALSVRLSPSWRTAAGRFSRPPVGDAVDRALFPLGQDSVRLLANATPVRTGRMRAGWRSTLVPTRHALRVTNTCPMPASSSGAPATSGPIPTCKGSSGRSYRAWPRWPATRPWPTSP
jgi:hypothetical protein